MIVKTSLLLAVIVVLRRNYNTSDDSKEIFIVSSYSGTAKELQYF